MVQVQPKHPFDARYTLSGMSVPVQATVLSGTQENPFDTIIRSLVSGRV